MSDTRPPSNVASDRPPDDPNAIRTMHDVFSDWERRAIIYYLQERDEAASVDRIARQLVGWRRGRDDPVPDGDETAETLRTRVVYEHAMRMAEFGIVTYRPRTGVLELSDGMQASLNPPWCEHDDTE